MQFTSIWVVYNFTRLELKHDLPTMIGEDPNKLPKTPLHFENPRVGGSIDSPHPCGQLSGRTPCVLIHSRRIGPPLGTNLFKVYSVQMLCSPYWKQSQHNSMLNIL
jgi:hypothetical protein